MPLLYPGCGSFVLWVSASATPGIEGLAHDFPRKSIPAVLNSGLVSDWEGLPPSSQPAWIVCRSSLTDSASAPSLVICCALSQRASVALNASRLLMNIIAEYLVRQCSDPRASVLIATRCFSIPNGQAMPPTKRAK
jgi:hypothetical protein